MFTHEESHRLASYLLEDVDLYKAGILLCFFTGIRLGELCALKWEDIHLEEQMLTISHTMQRLAVTDIGEQRTKIVITAPKTSSSKREIPLPDFLFEIVKKFYCSEKDAFFFKRNSGQNYRTEGDAVPFSKIYERMRNTFIEFPCITPYVCNTVRGKGF